MKYSKPAAPGLPMSTDSAIQWMEQLNSEKSLKEFIGELSSQGDLALAWAKGGDWETLAAHIEDGGPITDTMRAFLVTVLRGAKKPNNRAQSSVVYFQSLCRAQFVLMEEFRGSKRERAIDKAAIHFGVDRRTIRRDLKNKV